MEGVPFKTALGTRSGCLAARFASELCRRSALSDERAQGRPGADRTHGPPAEKNAGGRYHRYEPDIRPPLRNGFTAYSTLSPGTGCLAPVTRNPSLRAWHQLRDARTTRLDRAHRIVRRRGINPRCNPMRPPHPASTFVTIAKRPSGEAGYGRDSMISVKKK